MNIVADAAELPADPAAPVCVLADPADTALVDRALRALGAGSPPWPGSPRGPRRPAVHAVGDRAAVLALLVGPDERPVPVRMLATARGLLVVAADPAPATRVGPARTTRGADSPGHGAGSCAYGGTT